MFWQKDKRAWNGNSDEASVVKKQEEKKGMLAYRWGSALIDFKGFLKIGVFFGVFLNL